MTNHSITGRLLCIVTFALLLNACGVKNDLEIPSGQLPQNADMQDGNDPSLPPQPLGL